MHYYKKKGQRKTKDLVRIGSALTMSIGLLLTIYVFFPLLSWQFYFGPVFASQSLAVPIPKARLVTPRTIEVLLANAKAKVTGVDYTNARNWFPNITLGNQRNENAISRYTLSIPRITIKNAVVSTSDYDLSLHLVHYAGTPMPGANGNAVVFGHSTLPQLFNSNDYKTIFANLYTLKSGDAIEVTVEGVVYSFFVYSTTVVDPQDSSAFSQNDDDAHITLITCTPPGTIWKRLIVRARLQRL